VCVSAAGGGGAGACECGNCPERAPSPPPPPRVMPWRYWAPAVLLSDTEGACTRARCASGQGGLVPAEAGLGQPFIGLPLRPGAAGVPLCTRSLPHTRSCPILPEVVVQEVFCASWWLAARAPARLCAASPPRAEWVMGVRHKHAASSWGRALQPAFHRTPAPPRALAPSLLRLPPPPPPRVGLHRPYSCGRGVGPEGARQPNHLLPGRRPCHKPRQRVLQGQRLARATCPRAPRPTHPSRTVALHARRVCAHGGSARVDRPSPHGCVA
jgi:hypothetical protein